MCIKNKMFYLKNNFYFINSVTKAQLSENTKIF